MIFNQEAVHRIRQLILIFTNFVTHQNKFCLFICCCFFIKTIWWVKNEIWNFLLLSVNSSFVVWNNFGTELLSESSQIRLENESEKETNQNHELNAYRYIISKSQSFLRNLWTGLKLRSINCLRLKPIFEHYCWIFFVEKWKIQYENALKRNPPTFKILPGMFPKYWQLPFPLLVNQFNLVLPALRYVIKG